MTIESMMEQINDAIAPTTRAYSDPEIDDIQFTTAGLEPGATEAFVTVILKVKRTPWGVLGLKAIDLDAANTSCLPHKVVTK